MRPFLVTLALAVAGCSEAPPPVTATRVLEVSGLTPVVNAVTLSPDGSLVVVGDMDGALVARDVAGGAERWTSATARGMGRTGWRCGGSTTGAERRGRPATARRGARGEGYFSESAPACAICASCWPVTPDTPMLPMILPSAMMSTPPSSMLAPVRFSSRRLAPPCATAS